MLDLTQSKELEIGWCEVGRGKAIVQYAIRLSKKKLLTGLMKSRGYCCISNVGDARLAGRNIFSNEVKHSSFHSPSLVVLRQNFKTDNFCVHSSSKSRDFTLRQGMARVMRCCVRLRSDWSNHPRQSHRSSASGEAVNKPPPPTEWGPRRRPKKH